MAQDRPAGAARPGNGDAWSIVSYLLSGMLSFGGAGALADRWLGASPVFLLVGLLAGTALAIYLVYVRFGHPPHPPDEGGPQPRRESA